MKYRKKPVVIEAVQFLGFSEKNGQVVLSERPAWLVEQFGKDIVFFDEENTLTIKTLEGNHTASIGDYIIKGVKGELYPCKPDIFEQTYDPEEGENEKV